jgi:fumarate reductase subunit C
MFKDEIIESTIGTKKNKLKSRIPARLDYLQSASGLILAIFMIGHMLFVSTILISKDFMLSVTKMFELEFLIEGGSSILVFISVAFIFSLFIFHAFLATRKFPVSYKQLLRLNTYTKLMKHEDTNLWYVQIVTGFLMFFLGSVHLYIMLTHPLDIGPFASSDRMVGDMMWPLYLVLLFAVELHGAIGLYRLSVKWGWFDGDNPRQTRKKLKTFKNSLSVFMLILGIATLITYIQIGYEHQDDYGQRYKIEVTK